MFNNGGNSLKKYIETSFEELKQIYKINDAVKLKIVADIRKYNGRAIINKKMENPTIVINYLQLLNSSDAINKVYFNTYATLAHEFEHLSVLYSSNENDNEYKYDELITLLEFGFYSKALNIKSDINLNIPLFANNLYKLMKKNYDISNTEINANIAGYKQALKKHEQNLMADDIENYNNIIDAAIFLKNNIAISYDLQGTPLNKFSVYTINSLSIIKENLELLNRFKILNVIFTKSGDLKNIYDLYLTRNNNVEMYDKIITNYLISFNMDYSQYFEDLNFKKYIENLIEKYINNTIYFYQNINKGKVFIKDNKVLYDNLKFLKKAVIILNNIVKKYNLNINSLMILDNEIMYNTNSLIRTKKLINE